MRADISALVENSSAARFCCLGQGSLPEPGQGRLEIGLLDFTDATGDLVDNIRRRWHRLFTFAPGSGAVGLHHLDGLYGLVAIKCVDPIAMRAVS
jgi:hypothetical protein